jgi:hypothetical protein
MQRKIIVLIIIAIIIFSFLFLYPISSKIYSRSYLSSEKNLNAKWLELAKIAWNYFQLGVGVDPITGLHYGTTNWHYATDWDVGVYIQALIDAAKLGLLPYDGDQGFDFRVKKVLEWLNTRKLTNESIPFLVYNSENGLPAIEAKEKTAHPSDCGKLLLALYNLKNFRPSFELLINRIIDRHNFSKLATSQYFASNDIYAWYSAQGYLKWNIKVPFLREIQNLGNGKYIEIYGESIPQAWITSEPLINAILELELNELSICLELTRKVYLIQERRYFLTGLLTAFSEASYIAPYYYVYQWIVTPDGKTWSVYSNGQQIKEVPLIVTRIAFAFHSIYNTSYTNLLIEYLLPKTITNFGFYEGVTEDGRIIPILSDKGNGVIIGAARYYLEKIYIMH